MLNAMSLGPYASFIVMAYLMATVVVAMLIAWIALDYRSQILEPESFAISRASSSSIWA